MNRMTQVGMGLMTLGLVGLLWKGPRGEEGVKGVTEPVVEAVGESTEAPPEGAKDQPPGVEQAAGKAVEGAAVKPVEEMNGEGEANPEAVLAELRTNDVELAYQLGQDITELTPEGLARLKAEWEGQVQQAE